jgi:ABC-type sugar transport system permease subunit
MSGFGKISLVIPIVAYLSLVIAPIAMTARISLYSTNGFSTPHWVGLSNYARLATDRAFHEALANTLVWTVITMTVPTAVGVTFAAALNAPMLRAGAIFKALMFLPSTMSLVTLGIMFSLVYNDSFGALNGALTNLGLEGLTHDWLGDPSVVLYSLVAVFVWQYTGLSIALFTAGINVIPNERYEAAQVDGANMFQRFLYITIPGVKPVAVVVIVLSGIMSFRSFDLVYVMTKGGPDGASSVLGYLMYTQTFVSMNQGYGAAIAVTILLISLMFTVICLIQVAKRGVLDE